MGSHTIGTWSVIWNTVSFTTNVISNNQSSHSHTNDNGIVSHAMTFKSHWSIACSRRHVGSVLRDLRLGHVRFAGFAPRSWPPRGRPNPPWPPRTRATTATGRAPEASGCAAPAEKKTVEKHQSLMMIIDDYR